METIAALDGEWRQTSVSNLDEFLTAQGTSWIHRKIAAQLTLTAVIRLEMSSGMVTIETRGLPKAVAYPPFTGRLDAETTVFVMPGGESVRVGFSLVDHDLVTTITSESEPEISIRRELVSCDQMKMTQCQRGVTCERLFKRMNATPK